MQQDIIDSKTPQFFYVKNFRTGFHKIGVEKMRQIQNPEYDKIKTDVWDDVVNCYEYADVLYMGSCHIFAYALNKKFGYKIYSINDEKGNMCHCFCLHKKKGHCYYIDARGITTWLFDITKDFTFNRVGFSISPFELTDEHYNESGFKECVAFSEYLIEMFIDYYDVERVLGLSVYKDLPRLY